MRVGNLSSVNFGGYDTFKTFPKLDKLKKDAAKQGFSIKDEEDSAKFTIEYQDKDKIRAWALLKGYGIEIGKSERCATKHTKSESQNP